MSVFWIHAGTAVRVEKPCLEIAKLCNIPGLEDTKIDKLRLVKNWLEGKDSGKWVSQITSVNKGLSNVWSVAVAAKWWCALWRTSPMLLVTNRRQRGRCGFVVWTRESSS